MATQKITTDLHCRQARPGQELAVADTPGLRLRVYPSSGVKSWLYRYRVPVLDSDGNPVMAGEHSKTRLRKMVLGGYRAVSLKEARRLCQEQKSLKADRGDPIEVKRLTRLENFRQAKRERETAEQDAFTVDRLANAYVEKYALARKQSWREDQRIFKKHVVPGLGADTPLHSVRRKDVVAILDTIASTAPVQANRVLAVFRKACNWAVEREYLSAPPTFGVKAPGKEGRRDRYLSESELGLFLRKLPESTSPKDVNRVLELQVRLGLRLGGVCAAHWREMDLSERRWVIPAIRSKNNEPHEVLLTQQAVDILSESDTAGWVFPRNSRTGHLRVDTVVSELREVLPELGIEAFTSHALRHTPPVPLAPRWVFPPCLFYLPLPARER